MQMEEERPRAQPEPPPSHHPPPPPGLLPVLPAPACPQGRRCPVGLGRQRGCAGTAHREWNSCKCSQTCLISNSLNYKTSARMKTKKQKVGPVNRPTEGHWPLALPPRPRGTLNTSGQAQLPGHASGTHPGHMVLQTVSLHRRSQDRHVLVCKTGMITVLPTQADVSEILGECD